MRIIALLLLLSITGCAIPALAELPDAPLPAVQSEHPIAPITKHPRFFGNWTNRELVAAEFGVRFFDAWTTRRALTDPCHCMHEEVLPNAIAKSSPAMYAYSLGVAGAVTGLSAELWAHGHRKLSRLALMVDIGFDGPAPVKNYLLIKSHDAPKGK